MNANAYEAFLTQDVIHDHREAESTIKFEASETDEDKVQFTTWMPLKDASSFLQTNESSVPLLIRSGTAITYQDWNDSLDHGQINLLFNSATIQDEQ